MFETFRLQDGQRELLRRVAFAAQDVFLALAERAVAARDAQLFEKTPEFVSPFVARFLARYQGSTTVLPIF